MARRIDPQTDARHRLTELAIEEMPPLRPNGLTARSVSRNHGLDIRCEDNEVKRHAGETFPEVIPTLAHDDVDEYRREPRVADRTREEACVVQAQTQLARSLLRDGVARRLLCPSPSADPTRSSREDRPRR